MGGAFELMPVPLLATAVVELFGSVGFIDVEVDVELEEDGLRELVFVIRWQWTVARSQV